MFKNSLVLSVIISVLSLSSYGYETVPREFLIKLNPEAKIMQLNDLKMALKVEAVSVVNQNWIKVVNPEGGLSELKANSLIQIAEPNYIYRTTALTNDPKFKGLWAFQGKSVISDLNIENAWKVTTGTKKIVVAVIDTGINYRHPDLVDNVWINELEANGTKSVDDDGNGFVDDVYGMNFTDTKAKPNAWDDHGHGSHCSGTIGAKGDNGIGVVGINWNIQIMGVKFLSAGGSGTLEGAVRAIDYSIDNGAKILSNSWGGGGPSKALEEAIQRANSKGILFIAAAGNDSSSNDKKKFYPANYNVPNVISVAALTSKGRLASFSNYGAKSVHIAAPGASILSTSRGSSYAYLDGTSMATPHVSGVAALVWGMNLNRTHLEIKKILMESAKKSESLSRKVLSGALNAGSAVEASSN